MAQRIDDMEQETRPSLESLPPSRGSTASHSSRKSLTLDLSNLPPLTQPTPPSNTLIFTNLQSLDVFRPDNLQTIRDLIAQVAPIHAWSPLKSLKRIVVSFYDEQAAIAVRQVWDGEAILGERCRVYFGQPTPINKEDVHLALPDAGKLFFISPPPSPPHGWEMKMEDAPNKMVHADDLAEALAKLRHNQGPVSPVSPTTVDTAIAQAQGSSARVGRSRSSTLIFQPNPQQLDASRNGHSPVLPSVTVDDMTDEPEDQDIIMSGSPVGSGPIMAHTARPPVELMHDA
ncbi:putative calcineurin binding protein [Diplogelasinospora grovesii]|uniref:Calcineurin binding protein n=1 Tax=Diplogelasinospora grovesii TaxID=303347 RepID=A0AAN6NLT8_9PEZI|nr:putative calcineurin binding protein [Diplogelasinospora grovesii]